MSTKAVAPHLVLWAVAATAHGEPLPLPANVQVGTIAQFDGRYFVDDSAGTASQIDQFAFRTLRLDLRGSAAHRFDYRFMPDFAGGKLVIQDAYTDVHVGRVKLRFGKMRAPFGLERLQNEISTTFVERGLPTQLVPNRDLGVQLIGELGIIQYQAGIFDGVADGGSTDGDITNAKEGAARVIVRPIRQLAFGGAATFGDKTGTLAQPETPTWKTQGGSTFFAYRSGTTLADTVVADGRHWRATAQGTYYAGPIGVLAEYVRSVQHVVMNGTHVRAAADAWQVLAQWVITGEAATYDSVRPAHAFDPSKHHWGAFDIAARIGEIRMVDGAVFDAGFADPMKAARRAWSAGAGIDWFASTNFRFVIDVERTWFRLGAPTGDRAPEMSVIGRVQSVF